MWLYDVPSSPNIHTRRVTFLVCVKMYFSGFQERSCVVVIEIAKRDPGIIFNNLNNQIQQHI